MSALAGDVDDPLVAYVAETMGSLEVEGRLETVQHAEGEPPVDAWGLARVLLYCYSIGVLSSRLIARALRRDASVRALTGGKAWGHLTIARFRDTNEGGLRRTFLQAYTAAEADADVRVGRIKVPAGSAGEGLLEEDVAFLFGEAAQLDREETAALGPIRRGDEAPAPAIASSRPGFPPPVEEGAFDGLDDPDADPGLAEPDMVLDPGPEDPPDPRAIDDSARTRAPPAPAREEPSSGPPAAPPPTGKIHLMILPWSHQMAPGGTCTFRPSAFDDRGQAVDVQVRWEAEGGAIDEGGTYTAGPDAGGFEIRAIDQWTGEVARAKVQVGAASAASLPPRPSAPPPPEPDAADDPEAAPAASVPPEPLDPDDLVVEEGSLPPARPAPDAAAAAGASVALRVDRSFWEPGVLKQEVTVMPTPGGDQRHGTFKTWHPNGALHTEGRYVEGAEDGVWTRWYEDGTRELVAHFTRGVRHGLLRVWYPDGRPRELAQWVEGERDGPHITWSESGHPTGKVFQADVAIRDLTVPEIAQEVEALEREGRIAELLATMASPRDRGPDGESQAVLDVLGQADAAERGGNPGMADELRMAAMIALERHGVGTPGAARLQAAALFALSKSLLKKKQLPRLLDLARPRLEAIEAAYGEPDSQLAGLLYAVGSAGLEVGDPATYDAGLRALEVASRLGNGGDGTERVVFLRLAREIHKARGDQAARREIEAELGEIDPDAVATPEQRALAGAIHKGIIDAKSNSAAPGKATRVAVLPKSRIMNRGESFRFRVFAYDALDNAVQVRPVWSCTAGAVEDDGRYTADTPGQHVLTVEAEGTDLAAQATVTVQDREAP